MLSLLAEHGKLSRRNTSEQAARLPVGLLPSRFPLSLGALTRACVLSSATRNIALTLFLEPSLCEACPLERYGRGTHGPSELRWLFIGCFQTWASTLSERNCLLGSLGLHVPSRLLF